MSPFRAAPLCSPLLFRYVFIILDAEPSIPRSAEHIESLGVHVRTHYNAVIGGGLPVIRRCSRLAVLMHRKDSLLNRRHLTRSECLTLLGLSDTASAHEIRRAFRRLALKYHPDRNPGDPEAQTKFFECIAARDTLEALDASRPAVPVWQIPSQTPLETRRWSIDSSFYGILFVTCLVMAVIGCCAYALATVANHERQALLKLGYSEDVRKGLREVYYKYVGALVLAANSLLLGGLGFWYTVRRASSQSRSSRYSKRSVERGRS
jgi:hypothetical protein